MNIKPIILSYIVIIASCHAVRSKSPNSTGDKYLRVVNGWPAELGEVPYQVAFKARMNGEYMTFCGGTILTPFKLLSAAHCFAPNMSPCVKFFMKQGHVPEKKLLQFYAVAGNLHNVARKPREDSYKRGQWRRMTNVYYPRTYSFPKDDIAIVMLKSPFVYNRYVSYIPIAAKYSDYEGECLVSGYGRISNTETLYADKLLLANLEIVPRKLCSRKHRQNMYHFVCTSNVLADVGKGDSGGPFVCIGTGDPNEDEDGVLVGVVCGHRLRVGSIFTRVSSFIRTYYKTNLVP